MNHCGIGYEFALQILSYPQQFLSYLQIVFVYYKVISTG